MNEKKIEYLLKYLELLLSAHDKGIKSFQEISKTITELQRTLEIKSEKCSITLDKGSMSITPISENGIMDETKTIHINRNGIKAENIQL